MIQPKSVFAINARYVIEWLNGTMEQMPLLRSSNIFRKISQKTLVICW